MTNYFTPSAWMWDNYKLNSQFIVTSSMLIQSFQILDCLIINYYCEQ